VSHANPVTVDQVLLNWWEDHRQLADLYRWLRARDPHLDAGVFLEDPRAYTDGYWQMRHEAFTGVST
jgi:hypothetical protein